MKVMVDGKSNGSAHLTYKTELKSEVINLKNQLQKGPHI